MLFSTLVLLLSPCQACLNRAPGLKRELQLPFPIGVGMSFRAATCTGESDLLSLHTVCVSDAYDTVALTACSVLWCLGFGFDNIEH
jgi:hypothetical protein